jgi:hypothetical protein
MFLFTTPNSASLQSPPPVSPASSPVRDAIRRGAAATGTDFDYLLRTARRESSLDPAAKAPTSSATGLFQFIEQTWLGVVKNDGPALGLGQQASAIVARPDGTYAIPDAGARQAILQLREQPDVAAAMAGALTRRNRDALTASTGRTPSNGELYLAHVLGARGASQLISAARTNPDRVAAADFPEAARANRSIFFDKGGRARSSAEVYGVLTADKAGTPAAQSGDVKLAATDERPPGIYGLFQTGARQSPVSDAVARIWRGQNARVQTASAASYFPRSASAAPDESISTTNSLEAPPTGGEPIVIAQAARLPAQPPLPPARPAFASDQPAVRAVVPIVQFRASAKATRP